MEDKFVGIICSASDDIDNYYKSIARSIANYLASDEYNLIYGGGTTSMMGICYDEFKNKKRKIYALTTDKYKSEFDKLDAAKELICETTFDLKKELFQNSDVIVALPGGVGTYSELFSFIEEKRSNDKDTPIIIYDEDGYFLPFIEIIKIMQVKQMADIEVDSLYQVAHNKEEFLIALANTYKSERGVR